MPNCLIRGTYSLSTGYYRLYDELVNASDTLNYSYTGCITYLAVMEHIRPIMNSLILPSALVSFY
ncbi:unnamed protein product [Absidia cylindrospora]